MCWNAFAREYHSVTNGIARILNLKYCKNIEFYFNYISCILKCLNAYYILHFPIDTVIFKNSYVNLLIKNPIIKLLMAHLHVQERKLN